MLQRHSIDDADLLKQAIRGDADAFGRLYTRHIKVVYGYIYARVGHRLDAEDMTEDVFFRAFRSISQHEQKGVPFRAFLIRIAHNAVVDYYRSPVYSEVQYANDVEFIFNQEINPPDFSFDRLESQELHETLGQLRDDYRVVLILRFLGGLSYEETAQAMDRSVGSVRVLQHRALAALRDQLERVQ